MRILLASAALSLALFAHAQQSPQRPDRNARATPPNPSPAVNVPESEQPPATPTQETTPAPRPTAPANPRTERSATEDAAHPGENMSYDMREVPPSSPTTPPPSAASASPIPPQQGGSPSKTPAATSKPKSSSPPTPSTDRMPPVVP